jgi:uncharacterized paraquat-inducible protein A
MRSEKSAAGSAYGRARLVGPLLLFNLVVLPLAWIVPLFTARIPFLFRSEVSVVSGLVELWGFDIPLFAVVLAFAVAMPLVKVLATAWVWYRVPRRRARGWLGRLTLLGKLSMTEIFLLAVIVLGFKGVGLGRVEVAWGLHLFIAIALLSYGLSLWAWRALVGWAAYASCATSPGAPKSTSA